MFLIAADKKTPSPKIKPTTQPFVSTPTAPLDLFGDLPDSNSESAKDGRQAELFGNLPASSRQEVKGEKRKRGEETGSAEGKRQATGT